MKRILVSLAIAAAVAAVNAGAATAQTAPAFVAPIQQCDPRAPVNDRCVVTASVQKVCATTKSMQEFMTCTQQKFPAAMDAAMRLAKAPPAILASIQQCPSNAPAFDQCVVMATVQKECAVTETSMAQFTACTQKKLPAAMEVARRLEIAEHEQAKKPPSYVVPPQQVCSAAGKPGAVACTVSNAITAACSNVQSDAEFKICVFTRTPAIQLTYKKELEAERQRAEAMYNAKAELDYAKNNVNAAKDNLNAAIEREAKANAALRALTNS